MNLDKLYKILRCIRSICMYTYNNPKKGASILSILFFVIYMICTRTPAFIQCAWEATIIQSIDSENWRFNILPMSEANQCQYRLNKRWIPLHKPATDVGIDDLSI